MLYGMCINAATQQGQHQKFIKAALSDLPGFSAEQVEDHHKWHMTYCALLEDKRTAIQQWRSLQEVMAWI